MGFTMMELFNMLGGLGQAQNALSQQTGATPQQSQAALEAAMLLLLGALTRNAQSPEGAAALENALGNHTGQALDLFGQGQMPDMQDGQKILGHIFGNQQSAAVNAVGQRAGINPQAAMQILSLLAPLVLAYLSRQRQQVPNAGAAGGMDMGSILGGLLGGGMGGAMGGGMGDTGLGGSVIPGYRHQGGQPVPGANSGLQGGSMGGLIGTLNNVLDRDGDGNALDDLIGMFGRR